MPGNKHRFHLEVLVIVDVAVVDAGKYLCKLNNSQGSDTAEWVVEVVTPLSARLEPKSQTVDMNQPATMECVIRGRPVTAVTWRKDGATFRPDHLRHRTEGRLNSRLKLYSVQEGDTGMYQCFVENDQEMVQSAAQLSLGGQYCTPHAHQVDHSLHSPHVGLVMWDVNIQPLS